MVALDGSELVTIPAELEVILRQSLGKRTKLDLTTRLHHDLRIDGDDAFELLQKIAARYGTKFDAMAFADFFPDETEALSYRLTSLLGWKSDKRSFTIGHLIDVIERGQWFDPMDR